MTAALREKLHRWQQIEALSGFSLVSNPGLPALAALLNLDPAFLGLRSAAPKHLLISDDLDDMDEDISPGTLKCKVTQIRPIRGGREDRTDQSGRTDRTNERGSRRYTDLIREFFTFTFQAFSRRCYPKRLTISKFVRRRRNKYFARLTHSLYTTKIARIRCYTMLSALFQCVTSRRRTLKARGVSVVTESDYGVGVVYPGLDL